MISLLLLMERFMGMYDSLIGFVIWQHLNLKLTVFLA